MSKTKKSVDTTNDKYVVLRNGRLVSDMQYASIKEANTELEHWQRIVNRWPDGTKVTIKKIGG